MTHEELLTLIDKLSDSPLKYMAFETDDVKLVLSKETDCIRSSATLDADFSAPKLEKTPLTTDTVLQETTHNDTADSIADSAKIPTTAVKAPIVGVAYLQPAPSEPPYVNVGDTVTAGQVICLVEAMKLMNEITAPVSGTISAIHVENETIVEYGQVMIEIQ